MIIYTDFKVFVATGICLWMNINRKKALFLQTEMGNTQYMKITEYKFPVLQHVEWVS